ncbi:MAG: hypothetical protein ACAI18_00905 [Gemmatimonadales bacterium]|jgi:hypothetical protein
MPAEFRIAAALVLAVALPGCTEGTSALPRAREEQLVSEGIRRRGGDLVFRFTRNPGGRQEFREDRPASIVVTDSSVLIHKNEKVGLEITTRSRRYYDVERERERVRIRSGVGRREEIWSFIPPADPEGWTSDIRAVIRASRSAANR